MNVSETSAGTPVVERTIEEYEAYVAREVRRYSGLSPDEFRRAFLAEELDESAPYISDMVGLLRIGQNGSGTGP